jgi:hypothetical protein
LETLCQKPSPDSQTLESPSACQESFPADEILDTPSAYEKPSPAGRTWKSPFVGGLAGLSVRQRVTGLTFLLYASLLALVISRHEPWADEAQAWLMARDLSFFELFVRYLRYEGTPGLWHLLLMGPAKLGLPYVSMSILSGLIATGGILLFLTRSKVPFVLRLLLPFSFILLYQYAVVARSYVLLPLLLFAIAAIYRDRTRRIWLFTLLLCLLANANLHGLLIALSLALIYMLETCRQWRWMDRTARRRHVAALAVFGAVIFLLVLQLFPPADSAFAAGIKSGTIHRLVYHGKVFWPGSLSFDSVPWLSLPILAVSLVWFWRHKTLGEYVLPVAALVLFFALKYVAVYHQGVLFLLWVFAVWLGCERQSLGISRGGARLRLLDKLFPVVAVFVAVIQIGWSILTIQYDLTEPYSGSRQAAAYIKANHLQSKTIFVTGYHCVALLPYFQDNIFANLNDGRKPAFWWWSTNNPLIQEKHWLAGNPAKILEDICRRQPDVVVMNLMRLSKKVVVPLPSYAPVAHCRGTLFWKGKRYQNAAFLILWREDAEPPSASCSSRKMRSGGGEYIVAQSSQAR